MRDGPYTTDVSLATNIHFWIILNSDYVVLIVGFGNYPTLSVWEGYCSRRVS